MKRYLPASAAILLFSLAHAQAPEPPTETNTTGIVIFLALFVGFCVVFAWMVWRNRGKDKKAE